MHDSFKQSLNGSTDLIFHSDEICIPHQRPEECDEADSKVRIACVASVNKRMCCANWIPCSTYRRYIIRQDSNLEPHNHS